VFNLSAHVTRAGQSNLDINDHLNYIIATAFFGGQVQWERKQIASPYMDGEHTVSRRARNVEETVQIHVYGEDHTDLTANIRELVSAFSQNTYDIVVTIDSAVTIYHCEAANYSVEWSTPKFASNMTTATFIVPRKPYTEGMV